MEFRVKRSIIKAGGLEAISRWLSEAIPPEQAIGKEPHPARVQEADEKIVRRASMRNELAPLRGALTSSRVPVVSLRSTTG
jgi:hypothetical protein